MSATQPGITVIVPTYRRTADLDNCLAALERQLLPPFEVLITFRPEDAETVAYLARTDRPCLPARLISCNLPGVVYALTLAIDQVRSDFFAITDDDAIPHPDWLQRIMAYFAEDPKLAGVGGRDRVFAFAEQDWLVGHKPVVGIVTWYGKAIGFHHFGVGPARYVHLLKGVNMAFRTAAFGALRPDPRLRGKGAQVGFEMHLTLDLITRGYKLIYDPEILVDHIEGQRSTNEHRARFNPISHGDEAFNRTLIILEFLGTQPWGWLRQAAFLAFIGLRGSRKSPGLLLLPIGLLTRYPQTWERFKVTFAAYRDAIATLRSSPKATSK